MITLKRWLKLHLPQAYGAAKKLYYEGNRVILGRQQHKIIFNAIYRKNAWGDPETLSGAGSNTANTVVVRRELPFLVKKFGIQTMLDIPCGDFFWMKSVHIGVDHYTGADIVKDLIETNRKNFESRATTFIVLDILTDKLPTVDLILCRDCLPHFSFTDLTRALRAIRESGSRYLLTSTYTSRTENPDIATGAFRPLNLQISPLGFPEPIVLFNEECNYGDGIYDDKSLGLWRIDDLPL